MATPEQTHELSHLLVSAAKAHHVIFGGPNPGWPEWYAGFLVANGIGEQIGAETTVEQVADWLRAADEDHQATAPDQSWPHHYADLILGWVQGP